MSTSASTIIDDARRRLADRPREAVGEWARRGRIVPIDRAWRVGVLLIADDAVYGVGEVLRARTEAVRGYTATAQRERAERAAAAARGGFADGEIVHLGAERLDLSALDRGEATGPLLARDGVVQVRWSAAAAPRPLAEYLSEQIALG